MPEGNYLELCNFDSMLAAEPVFDGMQEVEVPPVIRAKHPPVFARGNVARTVTVSRIYELATAQEARQFELDHLAVLDGIKKSELNLEVKGAATYKMSGAVLVGLPRAKSVDELPPEMVVIDYIVYGSGLEKQANPLVYQTWGQADLTWGLI